jgi:hypothetical protein
MLCQVEREPLPFFRRFRQGFGIASTSLRREIGTFSSLSFAVFKAPQPADLNR